MPRTKNAIHNLPVPELLQDDWGKITQFDRSNVKSVLPSVPKDTVEDSDIISDLSVTSGHHEFAMAVSPISGRTYTIAMRRIHKITMYPITSWISITPYYNNPTDCKDAFLRLVPSIIQAYNADICEKEAKV